MPLSSSGPGKRPAPSQPAGAPFAKVGKKAFVAAASRVETPVVFWREGSILASHLYAMSYAGFVMCVESRDEMTFSDGVELVETDNIWTPWGL